MGYVPIFFVLWSSALTTPSSSFLSVPGRTLGLHLVGSVKPNLRAEQIRSDLLPDLVIVWSVRPIVRRVGTPVTNLPLQLRFGMATLKR